MPVTPSGRRGRPTPARAGTTFALLGVTVTLAACGSSSSTNTTGSSASAAANAGTTSATGATRRAEVAACLRKAGITLPQRPPGAGAGTSAPQRVGGGGGGGFLFGGGGARTGGTGAGGRFNNPQVRAALQKCGIQLGAERGFGGARRNNPAYRAAVTNFVACMRQNGIDLPAPNFSGKGPVLSAGSVNRNSPKFTAAANKCQGLLRFGPQAGGAPDSPGAPRAPGAPTASAQ